MTRPPSDSPQPGADRTRSASTDLDALERGLGPAITGHYRTPPPDDLHDRIRALSAASRERRSAPSLLHAPASARHREETDTMPTMYALPPLAQPQPDRPARLRHCPWRGPLVRRSVYGLGLVATLALIAVVIASAFSGYGLETDGPDGGPSTQINGAAAATTTPEPSPTAAVLDEAAPVLGTTPDGTDYIRVPFADCRSVVPVGFDQAMGVIAGDDYPFGRFPPLVEIAVVRADTGGYGLNAIPTGTAAPQDAVDAAVQSYAVYLGCDDMALHQAAAMTPNGLAREAYGVPNPQPWSGEVSGSYLQSLWLDGQGLQEPDEDHLGQVSGDYLYHFEVLEDGRLLAFLSIAPGGYTSDIVPQLNANMGYVLFAQVDGRWLVDEHFYSPT